MCEPNCDKNQKHKTMCGQDRPNDYVTDGDSMALQFYSDGTVNRRGFKVQYQWECGQTLIGEFFAMNRTVAYYRAKYAYIKIFFV